MKDCFLEGQPKQTGLKELLQFITIGIRAIDPRAVQSVDMAEEGFKEVCVELQQQIQIQGSLFTNKMEEMTTGNRELFFTFGKDKGVGQGSRYTMPPPRGYHRGTNWRIKKLEIPLFYGNSSNGWVLEAERQFVDYQLSEQEKLEVAVAALEGFVARWYDEEHHRRPIRDWEELKSLIIR
ncbi:hypothetical protein Lser_V15G35870 [Lactuca serriola]